jgi:hypothetical protein
MADEVGEHSARCVVRHVDSMECGPRVIKRRGMAFGMLQRECGECLPVSASPGLAP